MISDDHEPKSPRQSLRDILIWMGVAAAGVLAWGLWNGWDSAAEFSNGFFYAAMILGVVCLLSWINVSSTSVGQTLLRREVTPSTLAERFRRNREKLSPHSFSIQIMIVAVAFFLVSLVLAL